MISLLAFCCLIAAYEFQLSRLPSYGTPPKAMTNVAATYNNETNEIFVFGGQNLDNEEYSSTIFSFNLNTQVWDEVYCGSEMKPPGMIYAIVIMQSSTILLSFFGSTFNEISSECYRFDFNTLIWDIAKLKGDKIIGRVKSAYCEFEYNNTRYLAIYGGTTYKGLSSQLFLIEIETLIVKNIETINSIGPMNEATLAYYSGSLYLFKDYILHQLNLDSLVWNSTTIESNKSLVNSKSFIINDSMYIFYGFSYILSEFFTQVLKINLTDYASTKLDTNDIPQLLHASVQVNSTVYLLFGQSFGYLNSLTKYELTENSITKTVIIENSSYPSKRRNHASFQFDNELFIFGGISENGEYLNDVWKFDINKSVWSKLDVSGSIPEARELMAYNTIPGYGLLIFGGRSNTIYSNFYNFQTKSNFWYTEVKLATAEPPARYSSCIISFGFILIIIGGQNEYMGFSDIWALDSLSRSYYKVTTDDLPFELINHKCSLEIIGEDTVQIYVIGGSNLKHYPNNNIYKIEIKGFNARKYEVKTETIFTSSHLKSSESPLIASSDYLMMISGSAIRNYVSSKLFYYNISANSLEEFDLPSELELFGHTAVHLGKSIYVFGGGLSVFGTKISGSTSNQLYKLTWDELGCGSGSQGPNCEACEKGYYQNLNVCEPCPLGTYSDALGASAFVECIPCKYGTFNDKYGSIYCKECSKNDYCPISSTKVQSKINDLVPISEQPEDYKGHDRFLSDIQYMLWLFIMGVLSLILFTLLFFQPVKSRIKYIDLYINSHSQKLGTPVILRQTFIGGLFSVYFLSIALITIVVAFMGFIYDNVSEIKTLVPIATLTDEIKASTLSVEFQFYNYKGNCVVNGSCDSKDDISESGISYYSKKNVCESRGTTCSLSIVYEDFKLNSEGFLNFTGKDLLVSTTFFTIDVQASSSVPEGKSKSFVPIYPENRTKLFRGLTETLVSFEFIPSIFESDMDLFEENTGYHVRYKKPHTSGTTISQEEFYTNAYLIISLKLEISNTGFITKRTQNYSFGIFIGGLLGTIFGLMGSFGSAMGFIEGFIDKFNESLRKKKYISKVVEAREKITENFGTIHNCPNEKIGLNQLMNTPTQTFINI